MIGPGEIHRANLDAGRHKVVVVSCEELNRGTKALIALVTSQRFATRSTLLNCVPLRDGGFRMDRDCVVQCENVFPAFVSDLNADPVAILDDATLRGVVRTAGYVMDADCEPA